MEELIYCHDGSLTPIIAKTNSSGNWELYGISEVYGMGSAEYKRKLFDYDFSDIKILNSLDGLSFVCLYKNGKWGMLELKDNATAECEWKITSDFQHDDIDLMLSDLKINRFKYKIGNDKNKPPEIEVEGFNSIEWLKKFIIASKERTGFRELRAEIFKGTLECVKSGGYNFGNYPIVISNEGVSENTEFFDAPQKLVASKSMLKTSFAVIEADCIETAKLLKQCGFNPCVLNMANRHNPGGGVIEGAGAQEENIFRRSNLFMSLYQFKDYSQEYGIHRNVNSYPLNKNTGGAYSKGITIFRGSEKNGYCLLKNPFQLSFVSVPAINRPDLEQINGEYFIAKDFIGATIQKIRTILRIAGKYEHDCLVLSAFGCGAFCNPPNHMAQLFKQVFDEIEFKNKFKMVVFSIIDDHNSWKLHNPQGNALPFLKEFGN